MTCLVVGYSNIAVCKVIPALDALGFERIDVATRRPNAVDTEGIRTPTRVLEGYENGIVQSDAEMCYISTVNGAHYALARMALDSGKHTVVDKPITLTEKEAVTLVNLSREKRRLLSESVTYLDHARIAGVRKRMRESDFSPRHVHAVFCFPPLADDDFRYDGVLGGGALMDLGAYMVTPGRFVFERQPKTVHAWVTERRFDLPIGIRVVFNYEDGRSFTGYYSFDAEYQNEIRIIGRNFYLRMERFFTTPTDLETHAVVHHRNTTEEWLFPPCDAFAAYLGRIRSTIGTDGMDDERRKISEDQTTLSMIRDALKNNEVE